MKNFLIILLLTSQVMLQASQNQPLTPAASIRNALRGSTAAVLSGTGPIAMLLLSKKGVNLAWKAIEDQNTDTTISAIGLCAATSIGFYGTYCLRESLLENIEEGVSTQEGFKNRNIANSVLSLSSLVCVPLIYKIVVGALRS